MTWINMPWKVRRRLKLWNQALRDAGLDPDDVQKLTDYNSKHSIMHTEEYQAKMAELQQRYNAASKQAIANGG